MYLYSCIIFVSLPNLDSQYSTFRKFSSAADLGFLIICSPIFLPTPSSYDPLAELILPLSLFTKTT